MEPSADRLGGECRSLPGVGGLRRLRAGDRVSAEPVADRHGGVAAGGGSGGQCVFRVGRGRRPAGRAAAAADGAGGELVLGAVVREGLCGDVFFGGGRRGVVVLGQYPKVWLGESAHEAAEAQGDVDAAGLRELRVAAALVCQRLDMAPQWGGEPWWNRLGMGEGALPKGFDWARVLEAVDKAEDVFRGISPQLPAQW